MSNNILRCCNRKLEEHVSPERLEFIECNLFISAISKIPNTKGATEAISRRRTSNTMTKGKKTGQLIQGTNEK